MHINNLLRCVTENPKIPSTTLHAPGWDVRVYQVSGNFCSAYCHTINVNDEGPNEPLDLPVRARNSIHNVSQDGKKSQSLMWTIWIKNDDHYTQNYPTLSSNIFTSMNNEHKRNILHALFALQIKHHTSHIYTCM